MNIKDFITNEVPTRYFKFQSNPLNKCVTDYEELDNYMLDYDSEVD